MTNAKKKFFATKDAIVYKKIIKITKTAVMAGVTYEHNSIRKPMNISRSECSNRNNSPIRQNLF